jgi:molybdate transport system permease protein
MEEAYRLGEQLLVLARGRVAAFGAKQEIFRRPATSEVARLTGCKNISRAQANADGTVEALDWKCRLRLAHQPAQAAKYIGIRAHHIDFPEAPREAAPDPNVFPCWIVRTSETPFRITLFLSLDPQRTAAGEPHLQAEVFKEKWERFCDRPQPWRVRLAPESLFAMPE